MITLILRLALLILVATGLVWLAERPGTVAVTWQGQDVEVSVFFAVIALGLAATALLLVVWAFRRIWEAPSILRGSLKSRREKKAYEALSRGIIAAGAGDSAAAARHAAAAGDTLKNEPLVHLLQAHAAQLRGDKAEVARLFGTMSQKDDTALFGLRGLYTQARDRGDMAAARSHAQAAYKRNSRLAWAQQAMLKFHCAHGEWQLAAGLIEHMAKSGAMAKTDAAVKQSALLCAAAISKESQDHAEALKLASEAHRLDAALVPAALVMARVLIAQGQPKRALKGLRETWSKYPHRELAQLAAFAVVDSPEDQFERVRDLVGKELDGAEGRFALARAALAAKRFDAVREILAAENTPHPHVSICAMMADVEEANGELAKARAWLARGLSGTADPVWTSDGVALAQWSPVSPVSGDIVTCEWRSPVHHAASYQPALYAPQSKAGPPLAVAALVSDRPRAPDDPGVE